MSPDHAVGEVPTPHPHVARGDLQEELWLATFTAEQEGRENRGEVVVINFRGKTNFSTEVRTLVYVLLQSPGWLIAESKCSNFDRELCVS